MFSHSGCLHDTAVSKYVRTPRVEAFCKRDEEEMTSAQRKVKRCLKEARNSYRRK